MDILRNNYNTLYSVLIIVNNQADNTAIACNAFIDKMNRVLPRTPYISFQKVFYIIPNTPPFKILSEIIFPYDCCLITDIELSKLILPIIQNIFNGLEIMINNIILMSLIIIIIICLLLVIEFIFEIVPQLKSLNICIKNPKIKFKQEIIIPIIVGILLISTGIATHIKITENIEDAKNNLKIADNNINEWVNITNTNTKILYDKVNDILVNVSNKARAFIKTHLEYNLREANNAITSVEANLYNNVINVLGTIIPVNFLTEYINIQINVDFDIGMNVRTDILEVPYISIEQLLMPILLQMQETIKNMIFWICIIGSILCVLPIISVCTTILITYLKIER
jgi:hypothetical protein